MPNWLDIEFLKRVRTEERHEDCKDKFSEVIPYHYFEVGRLLLSECKNDFAKPQEVMSILEDIKEIRKEKLLRKLRNVDPDTPVHFLSYVGAQEVGTFKQIFSDSYGIVNKMQVIREKA